MTAAETIKNIVIIAGVIIALLRYVILNKIDTTREYNE